jgi:transcriptional regulator with XRE-family HTH domain
MDHINTIGNCRSQAFYYGLSVLPSKALAYPAKMAWSEWGKRLKAHMKVEGISQEKVGEHFDVTQGAVAHWLSGRREINLSDFFKLCAFVRADPRRILFGETEAVAVLSNLQTVLKENPGIRDMVARPVGPEELAARDAKVAAILPPAPRASVSSRRPKSIAHQRRKKGR